MNVGRSMVWCREESRTSNERSFLRTEGEAIEGELLKGREEDVSKRCKVGSVGVDRRPSPQTER
jgi:hypothetical protein